MSEHATLVYERDYSGLLDTIDDDGAVTVPDGQDLDVEYDWKVIEENRIGSVNIYE